MPAPPNILFITTDMQRYDTLGCNGNTHIATPHLDALAASGVRFTNAFVNNPVCMPSRASLFTGKVPSAHGVRWNAGGLAAHETTITRRLRDAGYQTAAIGKMHWGDTTADFGLDFVNVLDDGGVSAGGAGPTYREYLQSIGSADVPPVTSHSAYGPTYGAVASPLPAKAHVDGFVADTAMRFLRDRDRDKPFFCWTSFHGPHLPLDPATPWDTLYDPADIPMPDPSADELDTKPPEQRAFQRNTSRGNGFGDYRHITRDPTRLRRLLAHYWGKISMIDEFIGQILGQLAELGDAGNTVVIVTTDHGDFAGHHDLLFKNAFCYDDLLRVPLIVSAPALWGPRVVDDFVEEIDLPVTMLRLAGLEPHDGMQGDDLLPLLSGDSSRARTAVYAEAVDQRMIRTREWKLVHYRAKAYGELYHLVSDPGETINRYDDPDCAAIRDELRAMLVDRVVGLEERLHREVPFVEFPADDVRLPAL
ncbi:DUF4976 domain-containing protein [Jiangella aurantiaca]|uniref:DUF4976 domain-containing protein n=1 Tax=Jiangella aurantiaca TaxID=2530373 RepID=A0A4R5AK09_9ACTN|nr:sulfatase-like hydrolase/transferase [Jiangella aurantiaca]TDD72963.1 DUF4976 domain-containing protein [Jiangella aurantiaca]